MLSLSTVPQNLEVISGSPKNKWRFVLVNIKLIELLQVLACCLDNLFFNLSRMSLLPLVLFI